MRNPGILVVDDNPEILAVIVRMFSYFRIKVDCLSSAIVALNSLDGLPKKSNKAMIIAHEMQNNDRVLAAPCEFGHTLFFDRCSDREKTVAK